MVGWQTSKKRLIKEVRVHHKKDGFFFAGHYQIKIHLFQEVLEVGILAGLPTDY